MDVTLNLSAHTSVVSISTPTPTQLILQITGPDGVPLPVISVPTPATPQVVKVVVPINAPGDHKIHAFDADANGVAVLPAVDLVLTLTPTSKTIIIMADSISLDVPAPAAPVTPPKAP